MFSFRVSRLCDNNFVKRLCDSMYKEFSERLRILFCTAASNNSYYFRLYEIPMLYQYTDILKKAVSSRDGVYDVSNQNYLLKAMTSAQYQSLLLLYVNSREEGIVSRTSSFQRTLEGRCSSISPTPESDSGFQERKSLMKQYCELPLKSKLPSSNIYCTKLVFYHSDCVELLSLCAAGRNIGNTSKCAQLLPLDLVIAVLDDVNTYPCYPILKAFSVFLVHVYIRVASLDASYTGEAYQQSDAMEDDKVIRVIEKLCNFIKSVAVKELLECPNDSALKDFIFNGVFVVFQSYFSVEVEVVDLAKTQVAASMQGAILALQNLPSDILSAEENFKLDDMAQSLGMSSLMSGKNSDMVREVEKFSMSNPLARNQAQDLASSGGVTWGNSYIRFAELNTLVKTCPFFDLFRQEEINALVEVLLTNYKSHDSEKEGRGDNLTDGFSEKGFNKISTEASDANSVSSVGTVSGNFSGIVARLIKFCREEVDVLASKYISDTSFDFRDGLKRAKRGGNIQSSVFHEAVIDDSSNQTSAKNVARTADFSKNIPFVLSILAACICRFRKVSERESSGSVFERKRKSASVSNNESVHVKLFDFSLSIGYGAD